MITMTAIKKGVHSCFDEALDESHELKENEHTIGYIRFHEREEGKGAWIEFILAKERSKRYGDKIIQYVFDHFPFEYVEGTSIYEPHFFWKRIGATFDDEVDEDACDGTYFILYRENFYQAIQN
ncbi:hypothetical protein CVD28_03300 [Bacillus sp. M6-12]|uniref:hypothetical protein n=1 Tax=Bacillus sp. M6-12 TaxID=2054166 RepID=UPI000C75E4AB|nr:hypothetical protein [Bacillus sp. M6-12]PLS19456.1 hypothetical protein CVD28_03300 [Bacillus sp. M6-12]